MCRPLLQCFGGGDAIRRPVERREVGQARGHIGMLRPKGLLLDRERPRTERLSLGVAALGAVALRQVVEADGHLAMVGAEGLLQDRQRPLVKGFGLGIPALGVVEDRQVIETDNGGRSFRSNLSTRVIAAHYPVGARRARVYAAGEQDRISPPSSR